MSYRRHTGVIAATALCAGLLATAFAPAPAAAREVIRIVGSSTVFPFATAVAERFGQTTSFKTPIVESTGSGGGLKLFCAGVGAGHPDITDASRRIKASEVKRCEKNGVGEIAEVKIGYDGIVLANAVGAPDFKLTRRTLYLALAKTVPGNKDGELIANPYKTWNQIDASLPATRIKVIGPPPTSGTRDAFDELALQGGCKTFPWIKALKKTDKNKFKTVCQTIREDGAYVEAGENDNLIVKKLAGDRDAIGVFGFSYLDQNADVIKGNAVDGVAPSFENISAGTYPISRPLFFYVKKAHLGLVPGIPAYVAEFTSERAWGPEGYLADKGLIPMSDAERAEWRALAAKLAPLSM